jgi:hypothetical protein
MSTAARTILLSNFKKGLDVIDAFDKKTFTDQGHRASGVTVESIRSVMKVEGNKIIGIQYVKAAGIYQNYGVKAERFRIGWKRWKEVTYEWAKTVKPSLTDKEIRTFQYFVWRKIKREGMPTKASAQYSKDGTRTGWVKKGQDYIDENFNELFGINEWLEALLECTFDLYTGRAQAA